MYSAIVLVMTMIYDTPKDLLGTEGTDLGSTGWSEITQERIDLFAEATGDHQWIHTDPVSYTHLTLPTIYSV